MPVYRGTIAGRSGTLLLRADTAAKAKDQIVTLEALSGEQMADALAAGEKIWTPGDPVPPADHPAAPPVEAAQLASAATGDAAGDPAPLKPKPAKGDE